jgi:crotonobetainyl-CoA:carnitine CoA-transferase CaiB-like acyl-CoA transferase
MKSAPLAGVRILDLTSVVVGPACTYRLAQYGAEVIKVESPDGDLMRGLGGPSPTGQHSGAFLHFNRGKRNICLDLKKPAAGEVMERLVAGADVVVANMRPQALERLGLDPDTVCATYPDKVYCLLTGFGADGVYAGQPVYDSVVQAVSGMTGLTQARDGAPTYVPMMICDHMVGEIAAGAILAGLMQRVSTGTGCRMEVPMFETMAAFVMQEHLAQHSFDPPVGPAGDQRLLTPHNRPVETADGWISVTINTDQQVRAFLILVGRADALDDPRFATVSSRAKYAREWFEVRGSPLPSRTTAQWLEVFAAADIPAKPCHTLETLVHDPHLASVGLMGFEQHPTEGRTATLRSTIRFDDAYPPRGEPAQPRGWETEKVLREIGYSDAEVGTLIATGVAIQAAP